MIQRIFFIAEKAVLSGDSLQPEDNIFYSVPAVPGNTGSLEDAYALIGHITRSPLALALSIREPLTAENIRTITSFLFMPFYLTLEGRPVVILTGDIPDLLKMSEASLSAYFFLQGIAGPIFYTIYLGKNSLEVLTADYKQLLHSTGSEDGNIFFYAASGEILQSAIAALKETETDFAREFPQSWSLLQTNKSLEKELLSLRRKYASTDAELNHQKQYVEILRSDHATKELQDYYTREYEILPLWYKRLGHILKVLTGKRTFKSLFRDGVKKYKD